MISKRTHWVFVVNANCGRLLYCNFDPLGHYYVEEVERIENTWEGHERGRPSPLSGKSSHAFASHGHDEEETLHRFAREVADWLKPQLSLHGIGHLVLFAPPRFLGAIRKCRTGRLSDDVDVRQGDLAVLNEQELSDHPAIQQVVGHVASTAVRC